MLLWLAVKNYGMMFRSSSSQRGHKMLWLLFYNTLKKALIIII